MTIYKREGMYYKNQLDKAVSKGYVIVFEDDEKVILELKGGEKHEK